MMIILNHLVHTNNVISTSVTYNVFLMILFIFVLNDYN